MKKNHVLLTIVTLVILQLSALAQDNVLIGNVRNVNPSAFRPILENNEVRGYFFFYQSDKVDKKTNEYTIQIYDENLKQIKAIVFNDDKNIYILESAYNGSSIMFLFYNDKEKSLEYRAYDTDGKQKLSYVKELNKRSRQLLDDTYRYKDKNADDVENKGLFDIENVGFTTVYPVKEGKYFSYEVNFLFTDRKKQWTYEAKEEQEDKWASADYLGHTDSLIIFEVSKKKSMLSGNIQSWILGLNIYTGQKAFEISSNSESDYKFYPTNIATISASREFFLMGTYYDKGDKIGKDRSLGIGAWKMDVTGKIVAKKYNSWTNEIGKYLKTDKKGRIEDIGYTYFHKVVQTVNGDFYAIGEGYKKVASGAGILGAGLSMMGGGRSNISMFKIKVTDLVLMKFNSNFEISGADIYEKASSSAEMPAGYETVSPHLLALYVKSRGWFDYEFTKMPKDKSGFVMGYTDYEKNKEYKGLTFHTISLTNNKFTTDKINLNTKASFIRVLPAKTGSVMVWEYYKKKKEVNLRLEKMN